MAGKPRLDRLLVGAERLPRPGLPAHQPLALAHGARGFRCGLEEPFRALQSARASKRTGTGATAQEGGCPEMSDRTEIKGGPKSEETRQRIFTAALKLFHERGFEAATMRDIAE